MSLALPALALLSAPAHAKLQYLGPNATTVTQELWAVGNATGMPGNPNGRDYFVGVAFDDFGGVWISDDQTAYLRRFTAPTTPTPVHGSPFIHSVVTSFNYTANGLGAINGLVNRAGSSNTICGIAKNGVFAINNISGALIAGPYKPPGTTSGFLAITQNPNPADGKLYFTVLQPGLVSPGYLTAKAIWKCTAALGNTPPVFTKVFPLTASEDNIEDIDGIAFDPTGRYLFIALTDSNKILIVDLQGIPGSRIINTVNTPRRPDGLAFHQCGDNYLASSDNNSTISRYTFGGANNLDYSTTPTISAILSGGFRGDFVNVGPDGYMYAVQGIGNGNTFATRYDDGTTSVLPSLVQVGPCFFTHAPLPCTRTPGGMTDWWPLDESLPAATTTADVIGSFPGTIHGSVTSVSGTAGSAFHFPGSGPPAYVDCGPTVGNFAIGGSSSTQPTGAFTVDAWVKLDYPHTTCSVVVDKHVGTTAMVGYQLVVNSAGYPVFAIGNGNVASAVSSVALTPGWHHLAAVASPSSWINGSSPLAVKYSCALYVDGVVTGGCVSPFFSQVSVTNTGHFTIGGGDSTCAFGGAVDEVELFDRALTQTEVGTLATRAKCRCHVEACKLQQVGATDTKRETRFRICNDGSSAQTIQWSIEGLPGGAPSPCNKDGASLLSFSPSSGTVTLAPHACVTVAVMITIAPYNLFTPADMACYRITTDLCGPNGYAIGSVIGAVENCTVNSDTCFARHGGWRDTPVGWTLSNASAQAAQIEWFVRELGADGDTLYPVSSLAGLPIGQPTAPSIVSVPAGGSVYLSVPVRMVGSQAQHPTRLQLMASAVGDSLPALPVGDLSMLSDEASGSRFSGWAVATGFTSVPWREHGVMIHDRQHNRLVVLGGLAGCCYQGNPTTAPGVQSFSLSESGGWSELNPLGSGPSGHAYQSGIYDPIRGRLIVFGGWSHGNGSLADNGVYALSLVPGSETWTDLVPNGPGGPSRRFGHSAVYDAASDRMIVFGGLGAGLDSLGDTWALNLNSVTPTWEELPSHPFAKPVFHNAVYDAPRHRMVVFGGTGSEQDQLFSLSLGNSPAWSTLHPQGPLPPGLSHALAAVDSASAMVTVMGGSRWESGVLTSFTNQDIWSIPLASMNAWDNSTPYGGAPQSAINGMLGPPESIDGFFYQFGGSGGAAQTTNSLWALPSRRGNASALIPLETPPSEPPARLSFRVGPNPFRSTTTFELLLPTRTPVSVGIYDVAGRLLRKLDAGAKGPGIVSLPWDGRDSAGQAIRPGLYFVRVRAGASTLDGRVIRLN